MGICTRRNERVLGQAWEALALLVLVCVGWLVGGQDLIITWWATCFRNGGRVQKGTKTNHFRTTQLIPVLWLCFFYPNFYRTLCAKLYFLKPSRCIMQKALASCAFRSRIFDRASPTRDAAQWPPQINVSRRHGSALNTSPDAMIRHDTNGEQLTEDPAVT